MKRLSYIILPLILLCSFIFQSFKNIDANNQTQKIKIFELSENVKIKMIWVEPGSFIMGSPTGELGRTPEREAQHEVIISKGYWLAQTELTQLQWEGVLGNNPSFHKGSNLPVDQVSFFNIQEFLNKVNATQYGFRLPTEAEWEYACRAGSNKAYDGNRDAMVWHSGNSGRQSQIVASKNPNSWGFYDMQGNILEWCSDWFKEDNTNLDSVEYKNDGYHVQRGGQFTGRIRHTRAADRQMGLQDSHDFYVGFRLAFSGIRD